MASITIDEASRYLNVSTRTISTYLSSGILSHHKKTGSNKKYLDATAVHELLEAKQKKSFSIREFNILRARVTKLESQIGVLLRILDVKQVPLGIEAGYAKELYEAALSLQASDLLTIDIISAWVDVFLRLDENDIETMAAATEDRKVWSPFLGLCTSMIVQIVSHKEYKISLDLQALHRELSEGRRRIRLSALLYIEQRGYDVSIDRLNSGYPATTVDIVKKILKKSS